MHTIIRSEHFTEFPPEELKAVKATCGLRRADRFTALAAFAIAKAFPETLPKCLPPDAALITASATGPIITTFTMLDDIIDFPEDQIRPTNFSHSVHNAVTSYLSTILGHHGPAFAIANFEHLHESALSLADALLETGECKQALILEIETQNPIAKQLPRIIPEYFQEEPGEYVTLTLVGKQP